MKLEPLDYSDDSELLWNLGGRVYLYVNGFLTYGTLTAANPESLMGQVLIQDKRLLEVALATLNILSHEEEPEDANSSTDS